MNLSNKTVFITGGTKGLGLALSKTLLNSDCIVHTISSNQESIDSATKEISNSNFHSYLCDVTDFTKLSEVVDQTGNIDVLINNAGIWLEGSLTDNTFEQISKVIDVNFKGVVFVTKVVLPILQKNNDGFIVNVSSTSGLKGRESQATYAASKFAVRGFTESLKEDLKNTNIKVVGFYPGGMSTSLFKTAGFDKANNDWMSPDKIANVMKFILEQDDTMLMDHVVINKRGVKSSN